MALKKRREMGDLCAYSILSVLCRTKAAIAKLKNIKAMKAASFFTLYFSQL
jgi:hypothetical protein